MNWRQGLFRVWILASILWVVVVTYQKLRTIDVSMPWTEPHMVHAGNGTYPSDWGISRIRLAVQKNLDAQNARAFKENGCPSPERAAFCNPILVPDDSWKKDVPLTLWETAITLAPLAAGPPLAAVLLGAALSWAFVGFSRSDGQ